MYKKTFSRLHKRQFADGARYVDLLTKRSVLAPDKVVACEGFVLPGQGVNPANFASLLRPALEKAAGSVIILEHKFLCQAEEAGKFFK